MQPKPVSAIAGVMVAAFFPNAGDKFKAVPMRASSSP